MAHSLLSTLNRRYSANSSIRILELGCGTGYVTEQLSNLFPKAHITAIDFAESMIEVAKTRQNVKNVMFHCEDIERLRLEETYDVIISNATFQWLNDLKSDKKFISSFVYRWDITLFNIWTGNISRIACFVPASERRKKYTK